MKTVYIHGAFNTTNFGDHLLLRIIDDSCKRISQNEAIDIRTVYEKVNKKMNVIRPLVVLPTLKAVSKCDVVVCAGGGYFGEPKRRDLKWNLGCLKRHVAPLLMAVLKKKPIAILGTGAGDISSPFLRRCLRWIFRHASVISVRDKESQLFIGGLVPNKKIEVHPDWVMTNSFLSFSKQYLVERKNKILLHLNGIGPEKIDFFVNDLRSFLNEHSDYTVSVISDHHGKKQHNLALHLSDACGFEYIVSDDDPGKIIREISSSKIVITTKLHVGIVAIQLGCSVISLAKHPKIKRFYDQISYPDSLQKQYDLLSSGDLLSMLFCAVSNPWERDISSFRDDADKNLLLLRDFLIEN